MEYCILGPGRTGQGMVAYLASKGKNAAVWGRDEAKCGALAQNGVTIEGCCAGHYTPTVYTDIAEASAAADVLLVMTTSGGHAPVAKALRGHLRPNQLILILNGNLGAWEFHRVLGAEAAEKQVILAETGGMLLLCDYNENGRLHIKSVKNEMNMAALPAHRTGEAAARLAGEFPQLAPVASVVETSLNNANPVMHGPITLFNISRAENGEDYTYYDTAASAAVIRFVQQVDDERCAVIRAMGAAPQSCLSIINGFWPDKYDTLFDAIKNNPFYMSGRGPKTLDYRYITEDIPYGIAPLAKLGAALGVPTPAINAMLVCYAGLTGQDYLAMAPDVEGLAQAATA